MDKHSGLKKTAVTDEQWLEFCRQAPDATFFHTPLWAGLFTRRYPKRFRSGPLLLTFTDGAEVLLPVVMKRLAGGLFSVVNSMPGGTFGGPLSRTKLTAEQQMSVFAFLRRYPDMILRENPYQPFDAITGDFGGYDDPTQVVDCSEGYDAVWMRATAAHRNAVRNAQRSGVEIVEAQRPQDWDAYVSLYDSSMERWKKRGIFSGVRYDRSFFSLIEQIDQQYRRLFLARAEGRVIAGILCFYWNRHCVVWHGAGREDCFRLHPNNLLYDRALNYAISAGYRWFDCNPSGSLSGVYKFKEYFGARPRTSRVFVRRSPLIAAFTTLRTWRRK